MGSVTGKISIEHSEDIESIRPTEIGEGKVEDISKDALDKTLADVYEHTDKEHSLTLMQALKEYKKAVMWSIIVSLTIVMDGYNITLLSSLFGFASFKKEYGQLLSNGEYDLTASWQTALSMMNSVGNIFGIILGSWSVDYIGHKRLMQISFVFAVGFTFILVFANSKEVLLVGQLLMGFPNGVFGVIGPMYASEVCPVALRGYLTTYVNIAFIIGQLISQGVLKGLANKTFNWSYRIPFAVQWFWPVVLVGPLAIVPDSPWWLVRKGEITRAKNAYKRLVTNKSDSEISNAIEFMVHTTKMEQEVQAGATYLDCFRGVDLRRTEISAIGLMIQSVTLGNVMSFAVYFFEQAGIDNSNAFTLGIVQYAIGFVGTVISWVLLARNFGRRTLYLLGLGLCGLSFLIMGFISLAPPSNLSVKWGTASLLFVAVFFYDMTIGPIAFSLASEMSSTRLRAKTIGISRNLFHVWSIVNSVIYPYMLNQSEGNWKGKVGFFQVGIIAVAFTWAYFRLPEPAGRTYEELGIMFIRKVKARDFKKYQIDTLDINEIVQIDAKQKNAEKQ